MTRDQMIAKYVLNLFKAAREYGFRRGGNDDAR